MSFVPSSFRPLARGGWGGRASSHFRGALAITGPDMGLPTEDPQVLGQSQWGQIDTVIYRRLGVTIHSVLAGVSRDNTGAILASCTVELYHGKKMIAGTVSDASGNYSFSNPGSGPFQVIMTKPGLAGVSAETLIAV